MTQLKSASPPIKLAKGIYLWNGSDNGNVGVVIGDDGFVAIDLPTSPQDTLLWRTEIAKLTDKPLRLVIFTSSTRVSGEALKALSIQRIAPPSIIQDDGWAQLYSALEATYPHAPETGIPLQVRADVGFPDMTFTDKTTYMLNSAAYGATQPICIDIHHVGGCGPGGSYVTVRDTGIVFVGDHVSVGEPPAFGAGNLDVWLKSIANLPKLKNVKLIVPGHGAPGHPDEIGVEITDFVKALRSTMKKFMNGNHSREGLAKLVPPFVDMYATKRNLVLTDEETERLSRRVLTGLEQVYAKLTPIVQAVIV